MDDNLYRVESAVSATSSGNLTWEMWPHDAATALGLAGQRNPLGFAVVRYLSDPPSAAGAWNVVVHLASALVRRGYDGQSSNQAAWLALEAWNNFRCLACHGRGVIDASQHTCPTCGGSGSRDVAAYPAAVRDGIAELIAAGEWMEGQLAARLKRG